MTRPATETAQAPEEYPESAGGDVVASMPAAIATVLIGVVGLASSAVLTIERFKLLIDPDYTPSCSINPVLSCGSVMVTDQAAVFGFPNPIIGIAAFAVVIVVGVLALARVPLPTWIWSGLAVGTALGLVLIHYLIFQSLYRIGALCPYCMVVWAVTAPLLVVALTVAASGLSQRWRSALGWLWSVLVLWYVVIVLLIAERFWDYWSTLI